MTILPHILAAQSAVDRFFLPPSGSNLATDVDWTWNFILATSTFFFAIVVGAMVFFIFKYRRRHPNQKTSTVTHNTPLEIMWTVIPLIIVLGFFGIGLKGYLNYDTPASNAIPISVQAQKWKFTFTYPNGGEDSNLYLMKNVPVVLNIQSSDVLHAVYIPAFRTQRNAVPGRTTQIWFIPELVSPPFINAENPGGFDLFCTQYCGQGHSKMGGRVYVFEDNAEGKAAFDKKMGEVANPFKIEKDGKTYWVPYAQKLPGYPDVLPVGEKFYNTYCNSCHTVDGKPNTGPTWKGLYKSNVNFSVPSSYHLAATASDQEWDDYLNESILHPSVKIVEGFSNQMSDFTSQLSGNEINDEKRHALIEYIKSVGTTPYKPAVDITKHPELFMYDKDKNPNHPQSQAAEKAAATQNAQNK